MQEQTVSQLVTKPPFFLPCTPLLSVFESHINVIIQHAICIVWLFTEHKSIGFIHAFECIAS